MPSSRRFTIISFLATAASHAPDVAARRLMLA